MQKSHTIIGVDISNWSYDLRRKFKLRSCARVLTLEDFMHHLSETIATLTDTRRRRLLGPADMMQVKDMLWRLGQINHLLAVQVNCADGANEPGELVARLEIAMSLVMPTYIFLLYAGKRQSLL
jgi:hypothetical protein